MTTSRYRGTERFGRYTVNLRKRLFVPGVDGEGTVETMSADFKGFMYDNITGLVVDDFEVHVQPGGAPTGVIVALRDNFRFSGGRLNRTTALSKEDVYTRAEIQWTFTKVGGVALTDLEGITHPNTGGPLNLYTDQKKGIAGVVIRDASVEQIEITCTMRAKNGAGDVRVATLTKTVDIPANDFTVEFIDAVNGLDKNDKLDPLGLDLSATYTDSTRTLSQVGGFTSFDFAAATASTKYPYNKIYLTGANEAGFPAGLYDIESKTSNDAVVLKTALGADYTGVTSSNGPGQTASGLVGKRTYVMPGNYDLNYDIFVNSSTGLEVIGLSDTKPRFFESTPSFFGMFNTFTGSSGTVAPNHRFKLYNSELDGLFASKFYTGAITTTNALEVHHSAVDNYFHSTGDGSTLNVSISSSDGAGRLDVFGHLLLLNNKIYGLNEGRVELTSAANLSGATSFIANEDISAAPASGFLAILTDNKVSVRNIAYTSKVNAENRFVLSSALTDSFTTNNRLIACVETIKTATMFSRVSENSAQCIMANEWRTDSKDTTKDHSIYPAIYGSPIYDVSYNRFLGGLGGSYCVNTTVYPSGGITSSKWITMIDNYASDSMRFFADFSKVNEPAATCWVDGAYVSGNVSNVYHGFIFAYSLKGIRVCHNQISKDLFSTSYPIVNSLDWDTGAGDVSLTIDNNIGGTETYLVNNVQPTRVIELNDNNVGNTSTSNAELIVSTGSNIYADGNVLKNPNYVAGYVATIAGVDYTLEGFNTAFGGVNFAVDQTRLYLELSAAKTASMSTEITSNEVKVGGELSFYISASGVSTTFPIIGSSNNINFLASNNAISMRHSFGTTVSITVPSMSTVLCDGQPHKISLLPVTGEVISLWIDNTQYFIADGTTTFASGFFLSMNGLSSSTSGAFKIWDITLANASTTVFFPLSSGSLVSESATVGTGTATFTGIAEGNWTNVNTI